MKTTQTDETVTALEEIFKKDGDNPSAIIAIISDVRYVIELPIPGVITPHMTEKMREISKKYYMIIEPQATMIYLDVEYKQ